MKTHSSLIKSLAAKPFVILTGNSGTGKTKLAELFAQWICGANKQRFAVIPVGADWTDNRNVLGFVNHIRLTAPEGETTGAEVPVYQSTKILDLLLAAAANDERDKPHFLILDEMNLSHVERYFADFLSAMESREGELHLHREGRSLPRKLGGVADVPETLPLPRNVFVIGTVNVDETTYMFSPKVLDRANVIEFRVGKGAPEKFLESGGKPITPIEPAPTGYAEAFLELSIRARGLGSSISLTLANLQNGSTDEGRAAQAALNECNATISAIFAVMEKYRLEFAFRSMSEILRFLAVDYELTVDKKQWDWKAAMDAQILQKILPKLHGSKKRIERLLLDLALFCDTGSAPAEETPYTRKPKPAKNTADTVKFRESYEKLATMIESVRRDQFVSFI
jgi:5-methylcytosine-specific restriction protein B